MEQDARTRTVCDSQTAGHPGQGMQGRPVFSTAEAAEYLGRRPFTLRMWRARGVGPAFVRQGAGPKSRCCYLRADLDAWLLRNRVVPEARTASAEDAR